jgi:hypothetical protein
MRNSLSSLEITGSLRKAPPAFVYGGTRVGTRSCVQSDTRQTAGYGPMARTGYARLIPCRRMILSRLAWSASPSSSAVRVMCH